MLLSHPCIEFRKNRGGHGGGALRWVLHISEAMVLPERSGRSERDLQELLLRCHSALEHSPSRSRESWEAWLTAESKGLSARSRDASQLCDHRNWLGTLPRSLLRTGYHVVRNAIPRELLQELLMEHHGFMRN